MSTIPMTVSDTGQSIPMIVEGTGASVPLDLGYNIPPGFIKPAGTLEISANDDYDVREYAGVSVAVPIPAGYYNMSGPLAWMGPQAEHLGEVYSKDYKLSATGFNTWTPSTTAKDIVASGSVSPTVALDLENYEYLIRWRCDFHNALQTGATKAAQIECQCGSHWQSIHRRPYGLNNIQSMTDSRNYCTTVYASSTLLAYWNADGTLTWTTNNSYGIYQTVTAATFSSNDSLTPTMTIKYPKISARCSATYFATARAAEVDKANATVKLRGDLYRIKADYGYCRMFYRDAYEMYGTPL